MHLKKKKQELVNEQPSISISAQPISNYLLRPLILYTPYFKMKKIMK